jgi:hypothetical protein
LDLLSLITGNADIAKKYFEKGEIRDKDGNVIATYEQISLDEDAHKLAFEMQRQFYG